MTALAGWVPFRVRRFTIEGGDPVVDWGPLTSGSRRPSSPRRSTACCASPSTSCFSRKRRWRRYSIVTPSLPACARPRSSSTARVAGLRSWRRWQPRCRARSSSSEAPPVDHVLRAPVPEATRALWLRALMSALGQARAGDERHFVVKLDAWHSPQMALVRQAFPDVPCVFLYRDPAAVVASQLRMPGLHMLPGNLDPSAIGLDAAGVQPPDREDTTSRVLAAIYAAAVANAGAGGDHAHELLRVPRAGGRAGTRMVPASR